MSDTELQDRWEEVSDDIFGFEKIENKRSQRPDLHAFLLLDELFPGTGDMVSAAEHDEIYLAIEEKQAETLTDEQIIELSRCGVRCGEYGLCMFA